MSPPTKSLVQGDSNCKTHYIRKIRLSIECTPDCFDFEVLAHVDICRLIHLHLPATWVVACREGEARAEASEVPMINPKFSVERYAKTPPWKNQAKAERLMEAWRKAGLK